jgi:uncharacterized protein
MNCPICKKPVTLSNPFVPFCDERCKLLDLGAWADGSYVISTPLHKPDGDVEELVTEELDWPARSPENEPKVH